MTTTHRRVLGAGIAATALAAFVAGTPAVAGAAPTQGQPQPHHGAAAVVQRLPRPPRGQRRPSRTTRPGADARGWRREPGHRADRRCAPRPETRTA